MLWTATDRLWKSFFAASLSFALVAGISSPAKAQSSPWIQQAELTSSDGEPGDIYAFSVAISGSTAVVGAKYHKVGSNSEQGAAYVYVQNGTTWTQQAELTASDGAAHDQFGTSVAINGGTIVVGAANTAQGGAAYVFVQSGTTWSQQAELTPSDEVPAGFFGSAAGVSGSTIVVGAGGNDGANAAYVFVQSGTTWSQQAELTPSDGTSWFGISAAISGSTILVGAPGFGSYGAAYVFGENGSTWSQQEELLTGLNGDSFGLSVALNGSMAVVGAPGIGDAFVYEESGGTWSFQAELTPSDGTGYDNFGSAVGISGSTIVVGAVFEPYTSSQGPGAAYVFAQNGDTWTQQTEMRPIGPDQAYFGVSAAVTGSTIVVGADDRNVGSHLGQGAAFVYVPGSSTATVSPASLKFGSQAIDTNSAGKNVSLTNTGQGTVDISGITASANFSIVSSTCGAMLFVGTKCTVTVNFAPAQLGSLTGTLTFNDDALSSPQTVSLSGTGEAQATLTPASYTFVRTKIGNTSPAHEFTLKNNLSTTLSGISYSTAAPFAVSTSTCGTTLNSGKSCTISVTFSPTSEETFTGTLTVTDSANNTPQTSSLTGTGD
jgi:hypothetical protein